MASKTLILLGLFAFLLVVSEVAIASTKQSDTVKSESEETVKPDQYGGGHGGQGDYNRGGGYNGGGNNGGGGYNGGGNNGGGNYNGGGHNGGGNYNGGGHNGGGNYNGGGHNGGGGFNGGGHRGGGGGGGYCRHGCCYRGYRGCSRCCSYAGEAVQTQPGH